MEVKIFEIRDRATFVPVLAVMLEARSPEESYLINRAGYAPVNGEKYILMTDNISGAPFRGNYACIGWGDRTFSIAHQYIYDNWQSLKSGDVIDIEFILKETSEPKISERFTA